MTAPPNPFYGVSMAASVSASASVTANKLEYGRKIDQTQNNITWEVSVHLRATVNSLLRSIGTLPSIWH